MCLVHRQMYDLRYLARKMLVKVVDRSYSTEYGVTDAICYHTEQSTCNNNITPSRNRPCLPAYRYLLVIFSKPAAY